MNENWQAEQYRDECERIRSIIASLEAAQRAGTPREAITTLADESGVGEVWRKTAKP